MKKILLLACALFSLIGVSEMNAADSNAYAELNGSTLTFYYDGNQSSRTGTTYAMNTGTTDPGWYIDCKSVNSVVFDPSFADARPTTTYR